MESLGDGRSVGRSVGWLSFGTFADYARPAQHILHSTSSLWILTEARQQAIETNNKTCAFRNLNQTESNG